MNAGKTKKRRIDAFDFQPGRLLAGKYEVLSRLGAGWEGEVFKVREINMGIVRAAKFFYPHRNPRDRNANFYAKKLHRLRFCDILIQYHTHETIRFRGRPVTFLVSDYVEGELLCDLLRRQPGRRLTVFEGLHLLHNLASGIECIHLLGEYHGDLHDENIIVNRYGLEFDVKLVDVFHWGAPKASKIHQDVCDLIRVFYDTIGGAKHYAHHPALVKDICCGLKRTLILQKFRTAGQLREHLQTLDWD